VKDVGREKGRRGEGKVGEGKGWKGKGRAEREAKNRKVIRLVSRENENRQLAPTQW